jgi:membrane protein implicated in regulation of membrane protease activity
MDLNGDGFIGGQGIYFLVVFIISYNIIHFFFFLIMQDLLRAVQFIFVIFTVFLRTLTKRPRRQDDDNKQRKRQKQREQKTSQTVGSGDVIVVYDFV